MTPDAPRTACTSGIGHDFINGRTCRFCDVSVPAGWPGLAPVTPADSLDAPDLRGYPVTLYREPEDGSWSVMAPDLPGHIGAADTILEALTEAADAMTAWIEACEADGRPVPPPSDPHVRPADSLDAPTLAEAMRSCEGVAWPPLWHEAEHNFDWVARQVAAKYRALQAGQRSPRNDEPEPQP